MLATLGAARRSNSNRSFDNIGFGSAGEDPRSGLGKLRMAVATMPRNVVAAAAGEDPWSGPGDKEGQVPGRHEPQIGGDPGGEHGGRQEAAMYKVTIQFNSRPSVEASRCSEVEYPGRL